MHTYYTPLSHWEAKTLLLKCGLWKIFGAYLSLHSLRNTDDHLHVININDSYSYGVRVWKIKVSWNLLWGNWMTTMDDVTTGDF